MSETSGSATRPKEAVEAHARGLRSYVAWRTDAISHLDAALVADPDFALALLAKAWILHTARTDTYRETIEGLIARAGEHLDRDGESARCQHQALVAAAAGRGVEAGTRLEAYLARWPTDLFIQRIAQFELFWNGRSAWMRQLVERAAPHWDESHDDYGAFLSVRAFSNEEAGEYVLAERCGREAVERDPTDCWGAHAIAHVLIMCNRVDEGVEWLEGLSGNWDEANQIKHHLWWHLCLFLLERGEHDRILELLFTRIRDPESPLVQAVPDATIDLQNVASLLMRLSLRGVDVAAKWATLREVCGARIHNHANAFSNAHDMMILCGCGEIELAREMVRSMKAATEGDDRTLALAYRSAGIAVCEAVLSHHLGDHEAVVRSLLAVRHDLGRLGGSHAQRDIFYQILIDSARRSGQSSLVPLLFDDARRIGFSDIEQRSFYAR